MTVRVLATSAYLPASPRAVGSDCRGDAVLCEDFGHLEVEEAGGVKLSTLPPRPAMQIAGSAGASMLTVSPDPSAATMAVAAARGLFSSVGAPRQVHSILYCHSGPDEAVAGSPACRLQHELKQGGAFPFAIGQQGSVSPFTALMVAQSLLEVEQPHGYAVIVAADRWVAPLRRVVEGLTMMGDAAGALLLGPSEGRGLDLVDVHVRAARIPSRANSREIVDALARETISLVARTLDAHGWRIADLRAIVMHNLNPELSAQMRERFGAAGALLIDGYEEHGFLSAADTLVGLHRLMHRGALDAGDKVLVWGASPTRHIACSLFRLST